MVKFWKPRSWFPKFNNFYLHQFVTLSSQNIPISTSIATTCRDHAVRKSVVGIIYVVVHTTLTTRSIIPSSQKRDRPPQTVQGLDYSYSQTVSIRFKWLLPSPELAHSVAADIVVQHNVHHFISMVSALF